MDNQSLTFRLWKINIDRLKFNPDLEISFKEDYYNKSINSSRFALILTILLYSIFGILDQWSAPISKEYLWIIRYAIVCPVVILVFIISFRPVFKRSMQWILSATALILGLGIVAMIAITIEEESSYATYYAGMMLVSMATYTFFGLRLFYAVGVNILLILGYELVAIIWHQSLASDQGILVFVSSNFFFITTNVIGATAGYFLELYHRKDFYQRYIIEIEQHKTQALLHNILPSEIAGILKLEKRVIANYHENVSILFADVVNFTPLSQKMDPKDLVDMLNDLFSRFDSLVEKYWVEKIKTIGDCYMIASGIPSPRADHAGILTAVGLEMLDCTNNWTTYFGTKLDLRIGINSGPVVAGVIGHKKFAYDLWGDTVNIASRMESQGTAGKVQVAKATYELIKNEFEMETGGEIMIKGKGLMPVWFVKSRNGLSAHPGPLEPSSPILNVPLQ